MMPTSSCIVSWSVVLDVVGVLAARRARTGPRPRRSTASTSAASTVGGPAPALGEVGRADAGPAAEDEEVGERVAPEAVGAVHAAGHLAGGEEARHRGCLGLGVDAHAAHHVVAGRADLHGLGRDVDAGQLLELVVHRRAGAAGCPRRVRRVAMSRKTPPCGLPRPAFTSELIDAGHLVAGQQLGRAAVVDVVVVPAVGLFLGVGGLGRGTCRGCSRT